MSINLDQGLNLADTSNMFLGSFPGALRSALFAVLVFCCSRLAADPLQAWHWRSPLPTGNSLNTITYADERFVAAGAEFLVSSNGSDWNVTGTWQNIGSAQGLAYGKGTYVAVGYGGAMVSTNGSDWTGVDLGDIWLSDVCYGKGLFLATSEAGGVGGKILTSPDGTNWTVRFEQARLYLYSIVYGNGLYVAVGYFRDYNERVATRIFISPDGTNWIQRDFAYTSTLRTITYGNGQFIAGGGLLNGRTFLAASTNGMDWELRTYPENIIVEKITYGGSQFMAVGAELAGSGEYYYGSAYASTNGIDWVPQDPDANYPLRGVVWGNGQYVSVGDYGEIRISVHGDEWEPQNHGAGIDFKGIIATSNLLVAFDASAVYRSTNAVDWVRQPIGSELGHILYTNGSFFAAAGSYIATSPDGINWTNSFQVANPNVIAITYGNGRYVAVGGRDFHNRVEGYSWTSTDGQNWQYRFVNTGAILFDVAFGNGVFVAVGGVYPNSDLSEELTLFHSTDGLNWTADELRSLTLYGISYGNGRFVAVSETEIYISFDGINWSDVGEGGFSGVTYANGTFLAFGDSICKSVDGIHWTILNSRMANVTGAALWNNTFVAVGEMGRIKQSDPMLTDFVSFSLGMQLDPFPSLLLRGGDSRAFRIDYNSNAVGQGGWTTLGTFYPTNELFKVPDLSAAGVPQRFYRATVLP